VSLDRCSRVVLRKRGLILNYCGFERYYILIECGHENALLSGRVVYILRSLQLSHGTEAYGFRGEFWTCARAATVMWEELGVSYHKAHVLRLLKRLAWTPNCPSNGRPNAMKP